MRAYVLVAAVFISCQASAASCAFEAAVRQLHDYELEFSGRLASENMVVLRTIETLNAKAKDPIRSLGEQLSPADRKQFQSARETLLRANGRELALSNYSRDVEAISQMLAASEAIFKGATVRENVRDMYGSTSLPSCS